MIMFNSTAYPLPGDMSTDVNVVYRNERDRTDQSRQVSHNWDASQDAGQGCTARHSQDDLNGLDLVVGVN